MTKPIDHATADRLIPDRNEIPLRLVPRSLWLSAALLIAFVALGAYSQSEHETVRRYALLSRWEAGPAANVIIQLIGLTFQAVVAYIPTLSALVMLWISFLSPRWSDRTLWGAAMIFTAFELAGDASFLFPHKEAGEVMRTYPRFSTVVGLIAYGSWLLIIPGSNMSPWMKRVLTIACALALLVIIGYPAINAHTRVIDTVGSIIFAAFLFSVGLFVANRVGVNLLSFRKSEEHS